MTTFATLISLGAFGAVVGIVLAARCLVWVVWRYKQEAQQTPKGEIIWRLPLVFVPVTKAQYALIVALLITGRQATVPDWLPWTVGVAFALVAIVQGAVAAALGNPDRTGPLARLADTLGARTRGIVFYRLPFVGQKATPLSVVGFPIAIAILGVIETMAVLVLVATIVMVAR